MLVLQIANDYVDRILYRILFQHLENRGIKNKIYVPLKYGRDIQEKFEQDVVFDNCFSDIDRVLFFTKQYKMLRFTQKLCFAESFDLIQAHTVFSGGYTAWKLHQKCQTPYLVVVRNTDVNVFFRYMFHLRHTGVRILRDAAAVIFLSPAYRDAVIDTYVPKDLRQEIRAKSLVIPNGISDVFVQDRCPPHGLTEGELRLIYVGELNDNKNVATTIAAIEELRQSGMAVSFTVIGSVKDPKYEGFFAHYPYVTYLGQQPPEQVKAVMRQSDIFIMPSHTETFGLVYAEAMSQGLPVLYTKGQGFDGHFPDGTVGYAVDDHDPTDVSEKIKEAIAHYDVLARNAYESSIRFSWDTISERYKKLYQDIL